MDKHIFLLIGLCSRGTAKFYASHQATFLPTCIFYSFSLLSILYLSFSSPFSFFTISSISSSFVLSSFLLFLLPIDALSAPLLLLSYASSLSFDSVCFLPLSQSFPSSFSILPSLPPQVLHPHVKTDCWWLPRRERRLCERWLLRLAVTASTPAQVLPLGTECAVAASAIGLFSCQSLCQRLTLAPPVSA